MVMSDVIELCCLHIDWWRAAWCWDGKTPCKDLHARFSNTFLVTILRNPIRNT